MNIQAGKDYKTRGGQNVIIYATDKGSHYPVHGAVLCSDGTWGVESWSLNGMVHLQNEQHRDIVSEWTEPLQFDWDCLPKWADRFIVMESNGEWFCSNKKPSAAMIEWIPCVMSSSSNIPESHAPKNYTGDWKDSLHENPKYLK